MFWVTHSLTLLDRMLITHTILARLIINIKLFIYFSTTFRCGCGSELINPMGRFRLQSTHVCERNIFENVSLDPKMAIQLDSYDNHLYDPTGSE